MGIRDWFGTSTGEPEPQQLDEVMALKSQIDSLTFKLEEAGHLASMQQFYAEDAGWQAIGQEGEQALTAEGRRNTSNLCRAMSVINPLIKRGLAVRTAYVWGQGVGIQARADGTTEGSQDVNVVIQRFLDDQGNRRAFTGAQAHEVHEKALGTDGNVFVALFANPSTGFVRVRTIDPKEITEQVMNPEDASEPWYYRREYVQTVVGERTSRTQDVQRVVWYPALGNDPSRKPSSINGEPIDWSVPVYHVKANPVGKWGIPDAYSAIPWARAHKEFLEDWARLSKSLARIAWRVSGKKSSAQQARQALDRVDQAGGVAAFDPTTTLEAVPKTGATIDADSSRPLATMVAAALGVPVTTLMSDPGQTGARAVAETLNQPTRLEMQSRRSLWTEAYRAILEYVIDQAILAPRGPLRGSVTVDSFTGERVIDLAGSEDKTLVFTWPELDDTPVDVLVSAISEADATQKIPPLETMRLLLRALGVRDVDELVEEWTDEDGNWVNPQGHAGDIAVRDFERGNLAYPTPPQPPRGDEGDDEES